MSFQPARKPIDQLVQQNRVKGAWRIIPDNTLPDAVTDEHQISGHRVSPFSTFEFWPQPDGTARECRSQIARQYQSRQRGAWHRRQRAPWPIG